MRLTGKKKLEKLKRKNIGNAKLVQEIKKLVNDIEENDLSDIDELKKIRPDADCVHNDGFYFFNINIHRALILMEIDDGEATVAWVGTHDEYESTFKNNKKTIAKWLRTKDYIE
ncbi:MAG: type II toxin-antitoxin system HigB family toxin [Bacteroidota bacterium]